MQNPNEEYQVHLFLSSFASLPLPCPTSFQTLLLTTPCSCDTTDKEQNNEINSKMRAVEKKKGKGGTTGMSSNEDEIKPGQPNK